MEQNKKQISSLSKIWEILLPSQKKRVMLVLLLMCVGAILETTSIGLIIPAFSLITGGGAFKNSFLAAYAWQMSQNQVIMYCVSALLFVYVFKSLYLAFFAWFQNNFVFNLQANLSERIYLNYLSQPYLFYLNKNSSELIHNITNETREFTFSAILPTTVIITELLTILAISILVFLIEPLGALIIVCFGFMGYLFLKNTKSMIKRWGEIRQYNEEQRIQHLQQGFGGIKEVKLYSREAFFLKLYSIYNLGLSKVSARYYTLQALPRILFELLAILGLGVLCVVMIFRNMALEMILAKLSVFAAAAFRSMPSINRIIGSMTNLPFAIPVIDRFYGELKSTQQLSQNVYHPTSKLEYNQLIFANVGFKYHANQLVLSAINLIIHKNSTIGIIGASGAGKSTLLDMILGLLRPSHGEIMLNGKNINHDLKMLREWQCQIGYVPQTIFVMDDSLRRNIAFGLPDNEIDEWTLKQAIHLAQLDDLVTSLPEGLDTALGERGGRLSGGQRQRIGLARALYHNPSILVLDEATSSLDSQTEKKVMEAIQALHGKKTILIVTHRLNTVENCDLIYRLEKGLLVEAGKPKEILLRL